MTFTLLIGAAFIVGAVLSRCADRIEEAIQRKRDDREFERFWRNHVSKPYDRSGR